MQLLHGSGIRRPCREHERQRYARQPPGEIDQPAQGCDVGPVRIVDGHQHRLCAGQVDGQPVEPVQGRERRLAPGFRIGLGEDGLSQRCRPRQQDFTLGWVGSSPPAPAAAGRSRTATLAPARRRAPTERADPVLLRSGRPRANSICRSPPALPRRQPRLSPLGRRRATAPPSRARAPALRAEPAAQPRNDSRTAPTRSRHRRAI